MPKSITNQDFYNEGYCEALDDVLDLIGEPLGDERIPIDSLIEYINELKRLQENAG